VTGIPAPAIAPNQAFGVADPRELLMATPWYAYGRGSALSVLVGADRRALAAAEGSLTTV